ncbi:MAG: hypothetical protein JWO55_884 [Candidatus Saccharibacteria bacterium]|jgi:hypothetical protein|nr:hypothetical protein [Candidatus Saccharibacteria bacterium]
MKSKDKNTQRKNLDFLEHLNEHTDRHKLYYSLLNASAFFGLIYLINTGDQRLIDYINAPWLTSHISNLLGTIFLMVLLSGKKTFKTGLNIRTYVTAFILAAMNIVLELSQPINNVILPFNGQWENFNTPDPMDALFGIFAILIVSTLAWLKQRSNNPITIGHL